MSSVTNDKTALAARQKSCRRGYTAPAELSLVVAQAHQTRLGVTLLTAVSYSASVSVLALAAAGSWLVAPPYVAVAALLMLALLAGRQLRGLECLVHEASHFNWSRRSHRLNDLLGAILACAPTGARIADYRRSHFLHHRRFGTGADPDLQRYEQLGLESLERQHLWPFAMSVTVRLPRYQFGWLATITTSPVSMCGVLVWAIAWIALPAWLALGSSGLFVAVGLWLISYTLMLPVIRFVGEASEHVYREADTIFDATVSNIGFWHRALFHPLNDGYHTAHHMWPGVPHHQLRRLHNELRMRDAENYGRNLRYRTRVLQTARTGL